MAGGRRAAGGPSNVNAAPGRREEETTDQEEDAGAGRAHPGDRPLIAHSDAACDHLFAKVFSIERDDRAEPRGDVGARPSDPLPDLGAAARRPVDRVPPGQRLGESRGTASYHLRLLGRAGVIVEDETLGTRRERWWRRPEPQVIAVPGATPRGGC